jgi:hypothetical protein
MPGDHRAGHQLDLVEQHQGRITTPTCAAGNSTPAIGTPLASDFF